MPEAVEDEVRTGIGVDDQDGNVWDPEKGDVSEKQPEVSGLLDFLNANLS
jgi:hypothetical protein